MTTTRRHPAWRAGRRTAGRIYITYGPADEIESHPADAHEAVSVRAVEVPSHWLASATDVIVEFDDPARTGEYRMLADPSVQRQAIWSDVVKRGDMTRRVRGLGTLAANGTAEVKIAETQAKELRLGQAASVDFRTSIASGRVAGIDPKVVNGTVTLTDPVRFPAAGNGTDGASIGRNHRYRVDPRRGVRGTAGDGKSE